VVHLKLAAVGYLLYRVIGDATVLGELRHPTMHPMQPLRCGLGVCAVRTEVAMDEPPGGIAEELSYLTEPVVGYARELSERTPVIYVAADFADGVGDQAACGWSRALLELGPIHSHHDHAPAPVRGLFRRPRAATGAIDAALGWLGVPRPRRTDRFDAVGLSERHEWELSR
jgi:hypothetical protein